MLLRSDAVVSDETALPFSISSSPESDSSSNSMTSDIPIVCPCQQD